MTHRGEREDEGGAKAPDSVEGGGDGADDAACQFELTGNGADRLPDECLVLVFAHLDCMTLAYRVAGVCRRWRAIATDASIMFSGAIGRERGFAVATTNCCAAASHSGAGEEGAGEDDEEEADWLVKAARTKHAHAWNIPAVRRVMRAALFDHVACLRAALPAASQFLRECSMLLDAHTEGPCSDRCMRPVILEVAVQSGGTRCARYLMDREEWPRLRLFLWKSAMVHFNIDALNWACEMIPANFFPNPNGHVIHRALDAHKGDSKHSSARVVSFIAQLDTSLLSSYFYTYAARKGHLDTMQALQRRGIPVHECSVRNAIIGGHLECLRYLAKVGASFENVGWWEMRRIIAEPHFWHTNPKRDALIECLIYAVSRSTPSMASFILQQAASMGDLTLLRRLHQGLGDAQWTAHVCTFAAAGGRNGCLYYAHENGCAWDTRVWSYAAARGNVKMLAYALCHGCPCDLEATLNAAQRGGQKWSIKFIEQARDLGLVLAPRSAG